MAEPELGIDEVEVVVEALALLGLETRPPGLLVVPRSIGRASLHRRQDVNEAGVLATLREDLSDAIFLSKRRLAHELDFHAVFLRQPLRILPDLLTERLCKTLSGNDRHDEMRGCTEELGRSFPPLNGTNGDLGASQYFKE